MEYVNLAILIAICTYIAWQMFMIMKNSNTFKTRIIIVNAIYAYTIWCDIHKITPAVDYADMEDYDATDNRITDWGYTNILPKEKFELIAPFIREEKK